MARLGVPTVSVVIGEGGSGGAIAIAVADRVLMQENAIYSVISPEGCAAILWRDASQAKKAASAFRLDAAHCLDLGVIEGIVPEPEGGAQADVDGRGGAAARVGRLAPRRARRHRAGRAPPRPPREVPRHGRLRLDARRLSTLSTGLSPARKRAFAGITHPSVTNMLSAGLVRVASQCAIMHGCRSTTYREQARSATARPSRSAASTGRRARGSSSSGMPRAGSTTTSGSSETACSRAGPSPRAFRSRPANGISRCTSRTTRSTTPTSRARSRPGSTAPARSRSGIAARTSSSRRRRTAVSPSGCTASGSTALWTLVPAHLDGDPQELASAAQGRRRGVPRVRTDARDLDRRPADRGRAGPSSRNGTASARSRGSAAASATLRSRNDNDLTARFPRGRARARRSRCARRRRCSTARSAPSTRRAAPASGCCSRATGSLVFVAFDLLERDGEPLLERTYLERREALERLLDTSVEGVLLSPVVRRRRGARAGRPRARARGRRREDGRLAATSPGAARPTGAS